MSAVQRYDATLPTDVTCWDCCGRLSSTMRSGWATMVHTEPPAEDHPVRMGPALPPVGARVTVYPSESRGRARRTHGEPGLVVSHEPGGLVGVGLAHQVCVAFDHRDVVTS